MSVAETSKVNVLLIQLPFPKEYRWNPLGIGYLASNINGSHRLQIYDMNFYPRLSSLEMFLRLQNWDVVGISTLTSQERICNDVARLAKRTTGARVVVGGPHATVKPEQVLGNSSVDDIVVGEGEIAMSRLVNGEYRERGIHSEPFIKDLDALNFPARNMMEKGYFKYGYQSLIASRGCPFNCKFCQPTARKLFGARVRLRSPANVVAEIKDMKNVYNIGHVKLDDDTFTWNKDWVMGFCREVAKLGVVWDCNARVNCIDREMLTAMKSSGCNRIGFGIESGSQEILNYYRKGITIPQIEDAFALCKEVGMSVHAYAILGAPMETLGTIQETEELIERIKPDSIYISLLKPLPETDLYHELKKEGRLLTDDWAAYEYSDDTPCIKMDNLSMEQLSQERKRLMKGFYRRKMWNPIYLWSSVRAYPFKYLVQKIRLGMKGE